MGDEQQTTETGAEQPYAPPASGGDPDSRKRALKGQLAAAEASGDADTAEDVRGQLDDVNEELAATGPADNVEDAAAKRRAAAAEAGPAAASSPPQGRAAPNKATTVAKTKS